MKKSPSFLAVRLPPQKSVRGRSNSLVALTAARRQPVRAPRSCSVVVKALQHADDLGRSLVRHGLEEHLLPLGEFLGNPEASLLPTSPSTSPVVLTTSCCPTASHVEPNVRLPYSPRSCLCALVPINASRQELVVHFVRVGAASIPAPRPVASDISLIPVGVLSAGF